MRDTGDWLWVACDKKNEHSLSCKRVLNFLLGHIRWVGEIDQTFHTLILLVCMKPSSTLYCNPAIFNNSPPHQTTRYNHHTTPVWSAKPLILWFFIFIYLGWKCIYQSHHVKVFVFSFQIYVVNYVFLSHPICLYLGCKYIFPIPCIKLFVL